MNGKPLFAVDKTIYLTFLALAVITPLIFTTQTTELYEVPKMFFVYLCTTILLFATLIKFALEKRIKIPTSITLNALAIFVIIQALSTIFSTDKYTSIFGYPTRLNGGLLSVFSYFVIFTLALVNLDTKKAKNVILSTVVAAVAVALWGIPSHFGADPSCLVLTGKLTSACWQKEFDPTLRIFSTLGQPNWLASYLVLVLPMAIAFITTIKQRTPQIVLATSVALIFLTLVLSGSRAGAIGLGVSVITMLFLLGTKTIKENLKTFAILAILFLAITLIFAAPLKSRLNEAVDSQSPTGQTVAPKTQSALTQGGTESGQIRLIVWQGAINIFKRWPLLGSGPETFVNTYYMYRPLTHNQTTEWEFFYNKAHNEFLNYLANTGALGFISLIAFVASALITLFKTKQKENKDAVFPKAAIASTVGYLATIFFGFSTVATQTIFFMFIACTLILAGKNNIKSIDLKFLRNSLYSKVTLFMISLIALYTLTLVGRLYFTDTLYKRAQSLEGERSLLTFDNAVTVSPAANPYLFADFGYKIALYLQNAKSQQAKEKFTLEAANNTKKALQISPNNYLVNQKASKTFILLAQQNDSHSQATQETTQNLTKLAPTYPPAYLTLAKAQITVDQKQEALVTIKKALNLKPDYVEAQQLLEELTANPIQ